MEGEVWELQGGMQDFADGGILFYICSWKIRGKFINNLILLLIR
jgi:hypothetical protein